MALVGKLRSVQYWCKRLGELMPRRTHGWVWAGRTAALAPVLGLAGYLLSAGPPGGRASRIGDRPGSAVGESSWLRGCGRWLTDSGKERSYGRDTPDSV